jgi:hypothetical protein
LPPSTPGGALLFLDRARSGASSGPASDKSIGRVQPPSARSPGVGSTLRPDDSPGEGWLSPAMGETFQSRSRTAGAQEELAKKAEKFLGAAMGEGSIDSAIAENAARAQSPFAPVPGADSPLRPDQVIQPQRLPLPLVLEQSPWRIAQRSCSRIALGPGSVDEVAAGDEPGERNPSVVYFLPDGGILLMISSRGTTPTRFSHASY